MTQLPFGAGRYLTINIGEPIAVQQGTGVNRLLLPLQLQGTGMMRNGIPMSVSGCAWLSTTGMEWLGTWTTEKRHRSSYLRFAAELPNECWQPGSPTGGWQAELTLRSSAGSMTIPGMCCT
jgi:hypothetical protein